MAYRLVGMVGGRLGVEVLGFEVLRLSVVAWLVLLVRDLSDIV